MCQNFTLDALLDVTLEEGNDKIKFQNYLHIEKFHELIVNKDNDKVMFHYKLDIVKPTSTT